MEMKIMMLSASIQSDFERRYTTLEADSLCEITSAILQHLLYWKEARYSLNWEYMRSSWPVVNSSCKFCQYSVPMDLHEDCQMDISKRNH